MKATKISLVLIVTLALGAAFAGTNTTTNATKKVRRPHPTWQEHHLGGFVTKANSAQGKVVVLNAQKIVPAADFKGAVDYIAKTIRPEIGIVDVDSVRMANPAEDISKAGGRIGIVLVDSPDLPTLVTAPESRWSVVNVAALKNGAKDAAALAKRVRLEIMRGFALASGCAFMTHDPIVMRTGVLIPEDLDTFKEEIYGAEVRWMLGLVLPTYGVTPWKVTSYRKACEEGWANAPTNKWQKRIWDEVHKLPTNPLPLEKPAK